MASCEWKSDLELTGERIKARRKELHMTQTELAEEIGGTMTNRSISLYEHGEREMGLQTLYDIADALQTTPDRLAPERFRQRDGNNQMLGKLAEALSSLDEKTQEQAIGGIMAMLRGYATQTSSV